MTEQSFSDIYSSMLASKPGRVEAPLAKAEPTHARVMETYAPIRKSAEEAEHVGRRIASVAMLKSASSSAPRPDSIASVNGSGTRPTLESVRKSVSREGSPVPMRMGVDHHILTESDWADYNSFISSRE